MTTFVKGICEQFCPEQEVKLRIREKLLHYYEYKNGQRHLVGTLVKAFSRSAAGKQIPKASDFRTERCLHNTVKYLLKDIAMRKEKPYHFTYSFIFDRLWSVRQEIIIQNYQANQTIALMEPIIVFLAYSRYKLCEESFDNFDPKICEQHLQECLKRVLCCYDETMNASAATDETPPTVRQTKSRLFIEALYQMFNLGAMEALMRVSQLPTELRSEEPLRTACDIAMHYHQGNLYPVVVGIARLPHIVCCMAALKLPLLRRRIFEIFSHAYNNKQLTVPVEFLLKLTLHQTAKELLEDVEFYNLRISANRKGVYFVKNDFDHDKEMLSARHEELVDQKLRKIFLPEMFLLMKLA